MSHSPLIPSATNGALVSTKQQMTAATIGL
jgi:hypothetical protein